MCSIYFCFEKKINYRNKEYQYYEQLSILYDKILFYMGIGDIILVNFYKSFKNLEVLKV